MVRGGEGGKKVGKAGRGDSVPHPTALRASNLTKERCVNVGRVRKVEGRRGTDQGP